MKAIESPAGDPRGITFRSGTAGIAMLGILLAVVLYFPLSRMPALKYPFAVSAAMGLALYGALFVSHCGRGIRIDAAGVRDIGSGTQIGFSEIDTIQVQLVPYVAGRRTVHTRVATLSAADGRRISFSSSFIQQAGRKDGLRSTMVGQPEFLMALIADRTGAVELFPETWKALDTAPPDAQAVEAAGPKPVSFRERLRQSWGVVPLFLKLLKSIKPLTALLAFGVYSVVFSWKFGLVILILIGFHECGHVFAMFRCGVPVKGIYFIPFMGGAAVSKGIARTRREEAYIAANGPVWGTILVYLCFAAYIVTDGRYPVLAAAGAWGALINLFNLLPIMPLDGGRLLNNLAYSWGSGVGGVAVFASLLFGGAMAYWSGFELLVLMVLIGLLEFSNHRAWLPLAAAPAWLGPRRPLDFAEHEHFSGFVSPVRAGSKIAPARPLLQDRYDAGLRQARLARMTRRESLFILCVYGALVAALMAALHFTAEFPGHGNPIEILR